MRRRARCCALDKPLAIAVEEAGTWPEKAAGEPVSRTPAATSVPVSASIRKARRLRPYRSERQINLADKLLADFWRLPESPPVRLGGLTSERRRLTVRICENNVGALSSEFQRHSLQIAPSSCFLDQLADLRKETGLSVTHRDALPDPGDRNAKLLRWLPFK